MVAGRSETQTDPYRGRSNKDKEAREIPLPQRLVLMLERIEPKQGRVFDTTNIRKEWTKACAAVGLGRIIPVEVRP